MDGVRQGLKVNYDWDQIQIVVLFIKNIGCFATLRQFVVDRLDILKILTILHETEIPNLHSDLFPAAGNCILGD